MHTKNIYIQQIKNKLRALNPHVVFLFGSYAYGTPNKDSDIDLLVVTNDDYIPKNFQEKNELYLKIKHQIHSINQKVAIDMLVYTKPMFQKFVAQNSSFAREITQNGIIIYYYD